MNQVVIEETSFEEVLSEIEENSKYKRLPPKEKTWMTVPEMGKMLGLKKKEFRWIQLDGGKYRISKKSFDDWIDKQPE